MERKCGKFSFKLFVPFTVHLTSNKNLFSLINKDKIQVKTKYNVSLLKSYLDSDEKKITRDENRLPVQSANNHMVLQKSILQV